MQNPLRAATLLLASALALVLGPMSAGAQKALVYCPPVDAGGCSTIKSALSSAFPGGVDAGFDGSGGTVDLRSADLFQYSVFIVPSLAETDSTAPYVQLRDPAVADRLKLALIGRRAFWSGTPDQGLTSTTRPQKDVLLRNLAAWASADFATVNAPGLVVLQDNSDVVTQRYSWVNGITGLNIVADPKQVSYSSVRSLTAAGNAVLNNSGSTLAYGNMASFGFMTPTGAPGASMDAVGQTGTSVGGQIVLITQMGANTGGAVVTTDKDDYAPGTPVIMTGTGFASGETVSLTLHEDPLLHPDRVHTATADAQGAFSYSGFAPEEHDISVRFVLTAKGQTSSRVAQTTFTDGAVNVNASAAGVTVTATLIKYSARSCAGTGVTSSLVFTSTSGSVGGVNKDESFKLIYQSIAPSGSTFSGWSGSGVTDGTASVDAATNSICVTANLNNVGGSVIANVTAAPSTATTSLAVASASATFGGTATLSATLTSGSGSTGVSGKTVSFNLNGTAVCGGSSLPACPSTNGSGVASLPGVSVSGINAGTYATAVGASFAGDVGFAASSGTGSLQVTQATQSIAFGGLTDKTFGDADFQVSATATSGLPVSFAATGNCTLTNNTVSLTSAGSCTVTASQAGNTNYAAAAAVQQSFQIGKTSVTLALSGLSATYDGTAKPVTVTTTPSGVTGVSVTYSGSTTAPTNAGSYAIVASLTNNDYSATSVSGTLVIARAIPAFAALSAPPVTYKATSATVSGTLKANTVPATGTVSISVSGTGGALTASATIDQTGAFSATIDPSALPASVTGYDIALSTPQTQNFEAATNNSLKLIVNKASQSITFGALGGKMFGDAPFAVSATASSGLAVSFQASGPCTVLNSMVTITGAGSCTITAEQIGDGNYDAAPSVPQSFTVAKAKAKISVSGVTVTYDGSPHGATGTAIGVGNADLSTSLDLGTKFTDVPGGTASWSFDGDPNYEDASGTVEITINRAASTTSVTANDATFDAQPHGATALVTGPGGLSQPVTVSYEGRNGTTYGPSATAPTDAGDYTASASYAQSTNHLASSDSKNFTIKKATPTVTAVGGSFIYDANPKVGSGSASGVANAALTPVAVSYVGTGSTNYPTTSTAPTNAGTYSVIASFAGNGNYEAASDTKSLNINRANQTIVWDDPTSIVYGTLLGAAQLNATAMGVPGGTAPGALTYSPAAGTKLNAGAGQTLRVDAAATNNYEAATKTASITVLKAPATITLDNLVQPSKSPQPPTYVTVPTGLAVELRYNGSLTLPTAVGVYSLTATITDPNHVGSTDALFVIFDASGGFVTGGGFINSLPGACQMNSVCVGATGKANFGFVSKYQRGATVPSGNTEFQFHAGNLNFKSTSYDWLVVAGTRAQYKGDGTINGAPGYKFILTAVDGATDQFRIKIMQTATSTIVYDNMLQTNMTLESDANAQLSGPGTLLGGGSIQIQTK